MISLNYHDLLFFPPWHTFPVFFRKKGGNTMVSIGGLFSILTFLVVFADFVLKHRKKHKKSKRKWPPGLSNRRSFSWLKEGSNRQPATLFLFLLYPLPLFLSRGGCYTKWEFLLRSVETYAIITKERPGSQSGVQRSRDTVGGLLSSFFLSLGTYPVSTGGKGGIRWWQLEICFPYSLF